MPYTNFHRFWSICGLKTDVIEQTILVDPSAIEKLPSELKERLASFLSTRELLNLAETCKSVSSDLNLSVASSPLTDRASHVKNYRTTRGPRCFAVVIPKQETTMAHSMTFTCDVRDLGGAVVRVLEQNLPVSHHENNELSILSRRHGKLVAQSSTLQLSKLALSFPVKPGKFYQLYIDTRGRTEYLSNMSLHRIGINNNKACTEYTAHQFDAFEEPRILFRCGTHSRGGCGMP